MLHFMTYWNDKMKLYIFKMIQIFSGSRIFWRKSNNIYLSFDDGPHPIQTPILLDILKKYQARATFFVVGEEAKKHIDILKKVHADGHTIANHSYTHIRYENNLDVFLSDVEKCEKLLAKEGIPVRKLFRIPYGTVNLKLFATLLHAGYKIAFWNKDTKDYKLNQVEQLSNYLSINDIEEGDVVLMHDHPQVTPQLLELILSSHSDKKFLPL